MSKPHPLHAQLANSLLTRHDLPVSSPWLSSFLSSRGSNTPPLPALTSTAQFRILASDITTSLAPAPPNALPANIADVNVKEHRLEGTIIVQVLDVMDIGSSKWSQVEAIERVERGEEVRGREVIRTVDVMGDEDGSGPDPASTTTVNAHANQNAPTTKKLSSGPHKLLIQDAKGTKVLAFELVNIPKIALSISASASLPASLNQPQTLQMDDPGMFIGCKLLLKPGTTVRRGMVMLRPEVCVVLGGKVEVWDRKWKEERKAMLTALLMEGAGA